MAQIPYGPGVGGVFSIVHCRAFPHRKVTFAGIIAMMLALSACTSNNPTLSLGNLQSEGTSATPAAFTRGDEAPAETLGRREVIKNPTQAQLLETGPLPDRTMGNRNARVTVIEYGSWTCPYCREFRKRTWPAFKREYIDTGKVHYILREFPIGRSSGNAALITRCAPAKHYFRLYSLYLANQHKWVSQDVRTDAIYSIAAQTGMTRAAFNACLKNKKLIEGVKWSKTRGRELGVIGTPTFFINEKQVRSFITIEELRQHLDPLLRGQLTASSG
ncbi:MAG: DsbA family protein [Hyphomicrobiaceae bacterium]